MTVGAETEHGWSEAPVSDIDRLRRLADTPFARQDYSPLGPIRFLTIAPGALARMGGASDRDRLNAWLSALPCPVIGIAPGQDNALSNIACDAVVSSESELAGAVANIRRAPLAA